MTALGVPRAQIVLITAAGPAWALPASGGGSLESEREQ